MKSALKADMSRAAVTEHRRRRASTPPPVVPPALKFVMSSRLPVAERDRLENVVFFNGEQERVKGALLACVQRYGVPAIVEDGPWLRFRVPAFPAVQSLYAFAEASPAPVLAGVAMFVRESPDSMLLLHLAVHDDFREGGAQGEHWIGVRLIAAVRDICLKTRGVESLRLLYPREARLTVRPA
jgi:hypothetical protein